MMTVRNAEPTLPATLQSVAEQRNVSWELVVVDDGSTDGSLALLRQFAARHRPEAVKIVNTEGVGRGAALNLAWRACGSELIANIDADDLFHPDKLAVQRRLMQQQPGIVLLTTDTVYIGAGDRPAWQLASPLDGAANAPPDSVPFAEITAQLGRYNPVNHSSVMLRRTLLEALNGYDAGRTRQLDYELWVRAVEHGYPLHQLNLPFAAKRLHHGQAFEARISAVYILSSYVLQKRAIRALRLPLHYHLLALIRVLYRLTPTPVRRAAAGFKRRLLSS